MMNLKPGTTFDPPLKTSDVLSHGGVKVVFIQIECSEYVLAAITQAHLNRYTPVNSVSVTIRDRNDITIKEFSDMSNVGMDCFSLLDYNLNDILVMLEDRDY